MELKKGGERFMKDVESFFTLYDSPPDFPDFLVVKEWVMTPEGEKQPKSSVLYPHNQLENIRHNLEKEGFKCIGKKKDDDRYVIESWV
jgi:hypothetical protein